MILLKLFGKVLPAPIKSFLEKRHAKRVAHQEWLKEATVIQKIGDFAKTLVQAFIAVLFINGLLVGAFVVPTGSMENTVMTGDYLFVNKYIYRPSTPQIIPLVNIPLPYIEFPWLPFTRLPEKGDPIVFIFPGNREQVKSDEFQYYLKRCIATWGDTLKVVDKVVYVNGAKVERAPYSAEFTRSINDTTDTFPFDGGFSGDNYGPIRIPAKGDVITFDQGYKSYLQWNILIQRSGHSTSWGGDQFYIDNKPAKSYTIEHDYVFGMGDNRDNSLDSRFWGFIPVESVVGKPIFCYWSKDPAIGLEGIRWSRVGTIIR